ncbi:tetratricopeptide repeat protein [Flavobacteriaceae bacterium XHP0103]|uniref:tetratricopeptide repeat protein n=1 Tax=Marixanthotalea marina TaxID=2844359 RepID=UPI00298A073C|nr:tetratricopeptide repeat protein [Marixanthotalea marina]MBU3822004.1 tetratricopeptide repeat protein [Marixanthotalea marina]
MFFKTEGQTSVLNLANNLYKTGKYSKAIEQYKKVKGQHQVYDKIAVCFVAVGNFDEALKNYELHIKANPNDAFVKYDYAKLLFNTNKHEEASMIFKELVGSDSSNPNYHYQLGLTLEKLKDSTAITEYQKTFKLDSTHQKAIYKVARYHVVKKENQLAEYYMDMGLKSYANNTELISLKAQYYYMNEDYYKASQWFEKLLELGESSGFVHEKLSLCYGHLKRFEEAIEQRKLALEFNQNDAVAIYVIGTYYLELSDFINAEKYLKNALELLDKPLDAEYSKLAVVLNSQNKYDEALDVLKKAIKEDPESVYPQFMLALTKDKYYADVDARIQAYLDFKKRFPSSNYNEYVDGRISELRKETFVDDVE